jgi:hypothetical protein
VALTPHTSQEPITDLGYLSREWVAFVLTHSGTPSIKLSEPIHDFLLHRFSSLEWQEEFWTMKKRMKKGGQRKECNHSTAFIWRK